MMLDVAATWASGCLIALGAAFYLIGAIGLLRMPDLFSRLHAASVLDTAGGSLMLIGMMIAGGFSFATVKLVIILGVVIFTGPVATHALAQAALHAGVQPVLARTNVMGGPLGARGTVKPSASALAAATKRGAKGAAARRRPASGKRRARSSKR